MPRLLIVEDDAKLRRTLKISLNARHFEVEEAGTGEDAIRAAASWRPDAILLDLGLPDMDGLEVIAHLRLRTQAPVLVLSARHTQSDKVTALEAGADDFITKPFGLEELVARLRAAVRRSSAPTRSAIVETPSFTLDFAALVATVDGQTIRLTPTEWRLMEALARRAGAAAPAAQLLQEVWGPALANQTQYLRVYLTQLRKKLERDPASPQHLITVPGVGYRLDLGLQG